MDGVTKRVKSSSSLISLQLCRTWWTNTPQHRQTRRRVKNPLQLFPFPLRFLDSGLWPFIRSASTAVWPYTDTHMRGYGGHSIAHSITILSRIGPKGKEGKLDYHTRSRASSSTKQCSKKWILCHFSTLSLFLSFSLFHTHTHIHTHSFKSHAASGDFKMKSRLLIKNLLAFSRVIKRKGKRKERASKSRCDRRIGACIFFPPVRVRSLLKYLCCSCKG